jgi:hypothetical protein
MGAALLLREELPAVISSWVVTLLIPTIPAAMLIVISLQESFYNPQDCSTS